jgi:hypothetical protein
MKWAAAAAGCEKLGFKPYAGVIRDYYLNERRGDLR